MAYITDYGCVIPLDQGTIFGEMRKNDDGKPLAIILAKSFCGFSGQEEVSGVRRLTTSNYCRA